MSSWSKLKIEEILEKKLTDDFGCIEKETIYGRYVKAREKLIPIIGEIKTKNEGLTQHDVSHIRNLLENIEDLLDESINEISGIELYVLCLVAWFHDAGNVYGREKHNKRIIDIYNDIFGDEPAYRIEKLLVQNIGGAHTGRSGKGTRDTLESIDEKSHLKRKPIRARELAAIIRFADELAEGPQRTTEFVQENEGFIEQENMVYHKYANITNISISRPGEKIIVEYNICVCLKSQQIGEHNTENRVIAENDQILSNFLKFIYDRIEKLNEERLYAKFYSELLSPFKSIVVTFKFFHRGITLDLPLSSKTFDDKVVPGQTKKLDAPVHQRLDLGEEYDCETLSLNIKKLLEENESTVE